MLSSLSHRRIQTKYYLSRISRASVLNKAWSPTSCYCLCHTRSPYNYWLKSKPRTWMKKRCKILILTCFTAPLSLLMLQAQLGAVVLLIKACLWAQDYQTESHMAPCLLPKDPKSWKQPHNRWVSQPSSIFKSMWTNNPLWLPSVPFTLPF